VVRRRKEAEEGGARASGRRAKHAKARDDGRAWRTARRPESAPRVGVGCVAGRICNARADGTGLGLRGRCLGWRARGTKLASPPEARRQSGSGRGRKASGKATRGPGASSCAASRSRAPAQPLSPLSAPGVARGAARACEERVWRTPRRQRAGLGGRAEARGLAVAWGRRDGRREEELCLVVVFWASEVLRGGGWSCGARARVSDTPSRSRARAGEREGASPLSLLLRLFEF
jgi:hypothetical protein